MYSSIFEEITAANGAAICAKLDFLDVLDMVIEEHLEHRLRLLQATTNAPEERFAIVITGCSFTSNIVTGNGGALYIQNYPTIIQEKSEFIRNEATLGASIFTNFNSQDFQREQILMDIKNTTFSYNKADS